MQRNSKHTFFIQQSFSGKSYVYEIMWKNMVDPDRQQMKI